VDRPVLEEVKECGAVVAPAESGAFIETNHSFYVFLAKAQVFFEVLIRIPAVGNDAGGDDGKQAAFIGISGDAFKLVNV
jgi:hypothetical protein